MGQPAAKMGDQVHAIDMHIVLVPAVPAPIPMLLPHPFQGLINNNLSPNVNIMGKPAATMGSTATNSIPHFPTPPGQSFQKPPTNQGTIGFSPSTVRINGKPAARGGDVAYTCNDPIDAPVGKVIANGSVFMG
jgi:uncharacterized Zn-binding protein involved in type VI secretion